MPPELLRIKLTDEEWTVAEVANLKLKAFGSVQEINKLRLQILFEGAIGKEDPILTLIVSTACQDRTRELLMRN